MIKGKEIIDHSEKQIAAVNAEAWENMGIVAKGDADKTKKEEKEEMAKEAGLK